MLVLVNGKLVPQDQATVSVFDRGFLFGDGVYEMVRFFEGVGVAMDLHASRLARSCRTAGINGFDAAQLPEMAETLLRENRLRNASVYVQVTRGSSGTRAHMPTPDLTPTVIAIATATASLQDFTAPECATAIVRADPRWTRCDIKTVSLAGNILCLMEAQSAGADECILTRDGFVGEGAYTNVAIVSGGCVVTCPLDDPTTPVLHGTMRAWMLDAAREAGVPFEERPLREQELRSADEVLIMSSRRFVSAVVKLDGAQISDGHAGPVCRTLFAGMRDRIAAEVGVPLHC